MATRDGAKKWLRRAIHGGRITRPKNCQYCHAYMPNGAMGYQADFNQPWKVQWVCQECMTSATQVKGSLPADAYSTEGLARKVVKAAEAAMRMRYEQLNTGTITQEQADEDEKLWDERVKAATDAYALEYEQSQPRMVSVDALKEQVAEIEGEEPVEEGPDIFDMIAQKLKQ